MFGYIENINEQNFILGNETVSEAEALLRLPMDEYYANLDTFLRIAERRKEQLEDIKNGK